jgi:hypothetical protein
MQIPLQCKATYFFKYSETILACKIRLYSTFGVAMFKFIPTFGAAIIKECMILLPSPTQATFKPCRYP